jgi:hypothetical protein
VTPSPTSSEAAPPSQSVAEARAWAVNPEVAALPLAERTARTDDDPEPVRTAEGIWQLVHPDLTALQSTADGCVSRYGGTAAYRLCGSSYSEIQLLSADRSRLLRTYVFPQVAVQWIKVTRDAVYCGRTGDGGLPQSMLCRISRDGDLRMKGRFYACDGPDCTPLDADELATWPSAWTQGTEPIDGGFDGVELRGKDLVVTDTTGHVTVKLNPETLRER